jgi:hypothetical protein
MAASFRKVGSLYLAGCTLCFGSVAGSVAARQQPAASNAEAKQHAGNEQGFYCNIKALTPAERARHKELSDKLISSRTETVETEKGYEFQYRAGAVTLAELAEWAAAESKCCPFFDFHLDLENEGQLLCLRLTGPEGIKKFIRTEFHWNMK